jgi:hypothetical protein
MLSTEGLVDGTADAAQTASEKQFVQNLQNILHVFELETENAANRGTGRYTSGLNYSIFHSECYRQMGTALDAGE